MRPRPPPLKRQRPPSTKNRPLLADQVKAGKLPPIDQRLPSNPRVIKPRGDVGVYGGVWHRVSIGASQTASGRRNWTSRCRIQWDAPDPNTIRLIANWVEKWDQNADASEYTFYIRKGLKWSDGTEVTTDDTKFWWDDIVQNKDIAPRRGRYSMHQRVGTEYKVGDAEGHGQVHLQAQVRAALSAPAHSCSRS